MNIDPNDLHIEAYDPVPAGGMKAGMSSAVKVTHIPTGTVAISTKLRNQHLNRNAAIEAVQWMLSEAIAAIA